MFHPGQTTYDHMKILSLKKFPFTEADLKKAYRTAALKYHTDRDGGSHELATKVNAAKKYLDNLVLENIDKKENIRNRSHIKGLTEDCTTCKGSGEISYPGLVTCHCCAGKGKKEIKCKSCNNGIFTQINKREVPCKACKGTGIWKVTKCTMCSGAGKKYIHNKRTKLCKKCNGCGLVKVKVFNPVIIEGAILVANASSK